LAALDFIRLKTVWGFLDLNKILRKSGGFKLVHSQARLFQTWTKSKDSLAVSDLISPRQFGVFRLDQSQDSLEVLDFIRLKTAWGF
jgi:hypothetical protein